MCETICFIIQEIQNFCLIGWSYILKLIKCIFEIETLLAIFGGYIAWQQWQTNERKRKQDLFEKRYDNLYLPILKCSESIMHIKDSKVSKEKRKQQIENEIAEFWKQYNKYKFLISEHHEKRAKINLLFLFYFFYHIKCRFYYIIHIIIFIFSKSSSKYYISLII